MGELKSPRAAVKFAILILLDLSASSDTAIQLSMSHQVMTGASIGSVIFLHLFSLYTPHWEQLSILTATHTIAKLMEANYTCPSLQRTSWSQHAFQHVS